MAHRVIPFTNISWDNIVPEVKYSPDQNLPSQVMVDDHLQGQSVRIFVLCTNLSTADETSIIFRFMPKRIAGEGLSRYIETKQSGKRIWISVQLLQFSW